MKIGNFELKTDCSYFKGYMPCKPHKLYGVKCDDCSYYQKKSKKILIIKLGAIGDVIRTTTLLHRLWEEYPKASLWWLTDTPDVIPDKVDKVLKNDFNNTVLLQSVKFDLIINLDKDPEACSLATLLNAERKYGFVIDNGIPVPADKNAENKYLTGIFDDLNKKNQKSYPSEIYEICGFEYNNEEYILDYFDYKWDINSNGKKIVGLNTGCGERWISRLWDESNWTELAKELIKSGYYPVLLGGEQEHLKNLRISKKSGAAYLGHFSLKKFISLMDECDIIVTAVTMAMHIAIAYKKQLVLINNIFNPNEFELYGRGEIVQPDKECKCFFSQKCENDDYFCMEHLPVSKILNAVIRNDG